MKVDRIVPLAPVAGPRSRHPTRARIVSRTLLHYAAGADARSDRPAHVRAGSGVVLVDTLRGKRLLVVQDDASFLALVDPADKSGKAQHIDLPTGPGGRRTFDDASGNKKDKLDLECVALLPGNNVVALGSGSSDRRERIVVARVDTEPASVRVVDASPLYAALRAHPVISGAGAELNIEGFVHVGDVVRFFQRGNGKAGVDATFDVDAAAFMKFLDGGPTPRILEARRWDLGAVNGVQLTFTDACVSDGRVYVIAAAEDSPNAVDDGVVVGCAFGLLGEPLTPILDERGAPYVGKPEGLAIESSKRAFIVVDKDDHTQPCELLELALD